MGFAVLSTGTGYQKHNDEGEFSVTINSDGTASEEEFASGLTASFLTSAAVIASLTLF
eukprot:CAMPEP_0176350710 /NCGR_PEP_ID=MMETSP0126-20121128/9685_1 /TAXON_ID=141414 ORGANISM="Strombidinopsis acuminatum, Strain SPMC142" /NCGR_SAMPLE_ID=MMETSP0126 /ASSEMBLY_ACC=CAM_ASM_000229 /LENGTH=57 /DNA_ID=CAMNT_0017700869 /DNA_START=430 /DNA_END=603 /DNA_ORIENTATION=+